MTQLNPLAGTILASPQAQQQQAAERAAHLRKSQELTKNSGLRGGDQFEHAVESSEATSPVNEDGHNNAKHEGQPRERAHEGDEDTNEELPRLDLTA